MSNEKGHNGNGRRSIGTVIGGRGNSSASNDRILLKMSRISNNIDSF